MQSRLHQLIASHDEKAVIQFLKDHPNHRDIHVLFPLTLAAREGVLNIVLSLIYAGADVNPDTLNTKTPLYLALEYRHFLVAQVLMIYGANATAIHHTADQSEQKEVAYSLEKLKINPDIASATLLWAMKQFDEFTENQTALFMKALAHVNDSDILSGLIELAAQRNRSDLVTILLTKNKLRQDPAILTAGYWATIHAEQDQLPLTDEDKVIILRQLSATGKDSQFEEYFKKCSQIIQDKFTETTAGEAKEDFSLPPKQKLIYQAARQGDATKIKLFRMQTEDCYAVAVYAFQKKNFVALDILLHSLNNDYIPFLKILFNNNQKELALFSMINKKIDPYRLACNLDIKNQQDNALFNLLSLIFNPSGLLYFISSEGIQKSVQPSDKMRAIFSTLTNKYDPSYEILQRAIKHHHSLLFDAKINNKELELSKESKLTPSDLGKIQAYFERFGIGTSLINGKESKLVHFKLKQPWIKNIIFLLSPNDQAAMTSVSHKFYEWILESKKQKPSAAYVRNTRLYQLENELKKINNFIEQLQLEIESKTYCDNRFNKPILAISGLALLSLLVAATSVSGYFFHKIIKQQNRIHSQLEHIIAPNNQTCAEIVFPRSGMSVCDSDRPQNLGACNEPCERLNTLGGYWVGTLFGVLFGAAFFLFTLAALLEPFINPQKRGNNRFNSLLLTDFSDDTQTAANELLAYEEKVSQPNPFAEFNLASTLGVFRNKATEIRTAREIEYKQLSDEREKEQPKSAPQLEHKIAVNEAEIKEHPSRAAQSGSQTSNEPSFWTRLKTASTLNGDPAAVPLLGSIATTAEPRPR